MNIDQHNSEPMGEDYEAYTSAEQDSTPEAEVEPTETTVDTALDSKEDSKPSRFTKSQKIGAGALLTVGAVFGLGQVVGNADGPAATPTPSSEPSPDTTTEPSPTTEPTPEASPTDIPEVYDLHLDDAEKEAFVEQLRIPSGLSVEQLGQRIVEQHNTLYSLAENDPHIGEKFDTWVTENDNIIDTAGFARDYFQEYRELYRLNVYNMNPETPVSGSSPVEYFRGLAEYSTFTIQGYVGTYRAEFVEEPFRTWVEFVSATEVGLDQNQRTIDLTLLSKNNSHLFSHINVDNIPQEGLQTTYRYTLESANGFDTIIAVDRI